MSEGDGAPRNSGFGDAVAADVAGDGTIDEPSGPGGETLVEPAGYGHDTVVSAEARPAQAMSDQGPVLGPAASGPDSGGPDAFEDTALHPTRPPRPEDPAKNAPFGLTRQMPQSIGRYRLLGVLGAGGIGVVYRAEDPETGQQVAIKTVTTPSPFDLSGLRHESRTLARLHHPSIVRMIDDGVHEGFPWYSMELVEGRTWRDYNREIWGIEQEDRKDSALAEEARKRGGSGSSFNGPEPRPTVATGHLGEVLALARRLCGALAVLHGAGVVHRDLKPQNIVIRPNGDPVLMDLGLASRFRSGHGRAKLEVMGVLVGTLSYMAPEQAMAQIVDARTDLYALGCMLYETLTGQVPFQGKTSRQVLIRHMTEKPVPPSRWVDGVPPWLDDLILRLLAKVPRDRIGHADDVAAILVEHGVSPPEPGADSAPRVYLYAPELSGRMSVLERIAAETELLVQGMGGFVLIGGESGVGKTSVAIAASRHATMLNLPVITGECVSVVASTETTSHLDVTDAPLHPLRPTLRAIADHCLQRGPTATDRILGERGKILGPYQPGFADLPGQEARPDPVEVAAQAARQRVLDALIGALGAFAEEKPFLVILDDLQWADELTLSFLAAFIALLGSSESRKRAPRLLILGTYRTEEAPETLRAIARTPAVTHLVLERLGEKDVGAMVGDMLALPAPPEPLVRFLAAQSEGNPFFVAEYLRALIGEALLTRDNGRWRIADVDAFEAVYDGKRLPLPRTLHELVGKRLSDLEPSAREYVELAAVLGRKFDGELLARVARAEPIDALGALHELCARQVLERVEPDGYSFMHDKLREVAYAQIPEDRRPALHLAVAVALEAKLASVDDRNFPYGALAHHWKQAKAWDKAIDALEHAGRQAANNFANAEAASFFRQAVALSDKVPGSVGALRLGRWQSALFDAMLDSGEPDRGLEHAENALTHYGQAALPSSRLSQIVKLGAQVLLRMLQGRFPRWFLVRSAGEREQIAEAAFVFNRMIEPAFNKNLPFLGAYCAIRSLNLADRTPPSATLARSYAFMSMVVAMASLRGVAGRWSDRAMSIADQLGSPDTLAYCLNRTASYSSSVARWSEADERLARAEIVAMRIGDRRWRDESIVIHAHSLFVRGLFSNSLDRAQRLLKKVAQRGDPQMEGWGRCLCVDNLIRLGRADEALVESRRMAEWVEGPAGDTARIWAHASFALMHLELGDGASALEHARTSLALMSKEPPVIFFLGPAVWSVNEVYLRLGEGSSGANDSGPLLRESVSAARFLARFAKMHPFALPWSLTSRGVRAWRRGNEGAAEGLWRAAVAEAKKLAMPYAQALAELELGQRSSGGEAEALLRHAVEVFAAAGATPDLRRAKKALPSPSAAARHA